MKAVELVITAVMAAVAAFGHAACGAPVDFCIIYDMQAAAIHAEEIEPCAGPSEPITCIRNDGDGLAGTPDLPPSLWDPRNREIGNDDEWCAADAQMVAFFSTLTTETEMVIADSNALWASGAAGGFGAANLIPSSGIMSPGSVSGASGSFSSGGTVRRRPPDWDGDVPEPTTALLFLSAGIVLLRGRHRRHLELEPHCPKRRRD